MSKQTNLMRAIVVSCTLAGSSIAQAVLPDNGWYWNANESGRGFNIEIQNNVLFMAGFIYDAQSKPIWVVTGGPMSSDHTYSGQVIQTTSGQCLGCSYQPPTGTAFGTATINFTGPSTATITINGFVFQTERQQFGHDFTNNATPLLGEWAIVEGESADPAYYGERITLTHTETISGSLSAVGTRTGEPDTLVVGSRTPGGWSILLDYTDGYFSRYDFTFAAFDRIEGLAYYYEGGGSPGVGVPFLAQRIKTGAAAAGQNAPGTGQ